MKCFFLVSVLSFLLLFTSPALANETSLGCPDLHRDLSLTAPLMSGHDVFELQERLSDLSFYHGAIDGIFGEKTKKAVLEFQISKNLPPSGTVSLEVWDKLASGVSITASIEKLEKPQGNISIVINTDKKTLTVYDDDQVHVVLPVAVGKYETPTPIGEWRVVHKSTNWGGGFGSRWMGLNVPWGIFGIHGTNKPYSISTNASHGCIRMYNRDVEKLYPIIPLGTPVSIIAESYPAYPPGFKKRNLKKNMTGPDVIEMQTALKKIGILWGRADGRFGNSTEIFIKRYQALTGQEITGEYKLDDYQRLTEITELISPSKELNKEKAPHL